MDATTFDRLTTDLAVVGTRRGLLRLLAAIPLAGVLADLLDEVSEASCSGAGVGEATGADTVATATIRGMTRGAAEDTTTSPQDSQQLQGRHARPVLRLRQEHRRVHR